MLDYDEFIDAAMSGEEPDFDSEPAAPPDARRADEMLWTVGRLLDERADIKARFDARISQMETMRDEALQKLEGRLEWYGHSLAQWHDAVLREDKNRKTIPMPSGLTLKARAQTDEWSFNDDVFVEWAEANMPAAVTVPKPKPDKAEAKKLLKAQCTVEDGHLLAPNGDKVPGVSVQARPARHSIAADDQQVWPLP